ncbi:unnamed protein product [Peniophora sp. CBMAI 1063]|nr:unnamed protein product [Peniophora sp. CBMAI 1063]
MSTVSERTSILREFATNDDLRQRIFDAMERFNGSAGGTSRALSRFEDPELLGPTCDVVAEGTRGQATLVHIQQPDTEHVVELCGVLVDSKLPPWFSTNRLLDGLPKKTGIPLSYADIAFFDHSSLNSTLAALENIRKIFMCKQGDIDALKYGECVNGGVVVRAQNRVACPPKDLQAGIVDLGDPGKDIDPQGIFRKQILKSRGLCYTSENEVSFYRASNVTGAFGDMSWTKIPPREVRPGMVVNVQAVPVVIPTAKGTLKMALKLRSIMIISDEALKVS